ncbi:MAG: T9SS type A sorting domain-containing protein [Bacteroidota bacterium]
MNPIIKYVLAIMLALHFVSSSAQVWEWAQQGGGTDQEVALDVIHDDQKDLYVAGYYSGTAQFGSTTLNSAGGQDGFIAKYGIDGSLIWINSSSGTGECHITAVELGFDGMLYTTGWFNGSLTFSAGDPSTFATSGGRDLFVAQFDPATGDLGYFRSWGGNAASFVEGFDIATCPTGDVFVAGYFEDDLVIDSVPRYNANTMMYEASDTFLLSAAGFSDVLIMRLRADGLAYWAKKAGSPERRSNFDWAQGMELRGDRLMVTGHYTGTATFGEDDPVQGFTTTTISSKGERDIFLTRIDTVNGQPIWVQTGGSPEPDWALDVAINSNGDTYITGAYSDDAGFSDDASHATETLLNNFNKRDIFIARYDPNGNLTWLQQAGGFGDEEGSALCLDEQDNLYVTGYFSSSNADFGGTSLSPVNVRAFFIARYCPQNMLEWVDQAETGSSWEAPRAITHPSIHDKVDSLVIVGDFIGTAEFSSTTLTASGIFNDAFVAMYRGIPTANNPSIPNFSLSIFPNPTSGLMYLDLPSLQQATMVEVYDMKGRRIVRKQFSANQSGQTQSLQIPYASEGVYFLTLSTEGYQPLTRRLLLKH